MSMGAKILRGAGWLLACLGVAAAFLGVQVVVLLFTQSLAYLLADLTANALGSKPTAALDLYLSLFVQIASLILFWWWWHRLEPRSFLRARRLPLDGAPAMRLKRIAGLVLLGVGMQLIVAVVLSLLTTVIPEMMRDYTQMVEDTGTSDLNVLSLVVLTLGAPLTEELTCRGVMLEFALRGICPAWRARWIRQSHAPRAPQSLDAPTPPGVSAPCDAPASHGAAAMPEPVTSHEAAATPEAVSTHKALAPHEAPHAAAGTPEMPAAPAQPVPLVRFAVAALVQALLFGLLHGNPIQTGYATIAGLVLAAVAWRTGRLAHSMLLHGVVNISSFAVTPLVNALGMLGDLGIVAGPLLMCAAGAWLFWSATRNPAPQAI